MNTRVNEITKQAIRLFAYLLLALAIVNFIRLIPSGIIVRLLGISGVPYGANLYERYFSYVIDGIFPAICVSVAIACGAAICDAIETRKQK